MPDSVPPNIISALNLISHSTKLRSKTSSVIRKEETEIKEDKVKIIGGDSRDLEHTDHPAIVIEKNGDVISKIIVRCPCGRHSELVCEYDEESEANDMTTNMMQELQQPSDDSNNSTNLSQPPANEDRLTENSHRENEPPGSTNADVDPDKHFDASVAQEMATKALGGDLLE